MMPKKKQISCVALKNHYHTFTIFMILILSASPSLASCKKCKFEWNTIGYCVTGPTMPINQLITNTTFMCFSSDADRIDLRIICRKHREVKCPQGIFTIPVKNIAPIWPNTCM